MAKVGFIGLGNMGMPMAENLLKAAYEVTGFDLNADATERLAHKGASRANSLADACNAAEIIITMLPAGEHVREVYLGAGGVLASVGPGTLLIDSSTIDVQTAREVAQAAQNNGLAMVDAPVSGGVAGAEAGLTFMVGGSDEAFERAQPVLENGQDHRPCRRAGKWSGGQELQQHDSRCLDDRGVGGLPAGGKARAGCTKAV